MMRVLLKELKELVVKVCKRFLVDEVCRLT